jgi:hypothetical protein
MKVSQHPDMIASCLPFPLCLSVRSSVLALGTLIVLGTRLLQTSKLFERKKETDETFDDAPGLLTITRVGPECWDTVGPTLLCNDAWLMSVLNDVTKKDMRKCGRDRGSSANLRPTHRVVPCCWLVGSLHRRSWVAHFLQSHGCVASSSWLPDHTGRTNAADEWS